MKRIYNWILNKFYRIRGRLFGWKSVPFTIKDSNLTILDDNRFDIPEEALQAIRDEVDRELIHELQRIAYPSSPEKQSGHPASVPHVGDE